MLGNGACGTPVIIFKPLITTRGSVRWYPSLIQSLSASVDSYLASGIMLGVEYLRPGQALSLPGSLFIELVQHFNRFSWLQRAYKTGGFAPVPRRLSLSALDFSGLCPCAKVPEPRMEDTDRSKTSDRFEKTSSISSSLEKLAVSLSTRHPEERCHPLKMDVRGQVGQPAKPSPQTGIAIELDSLQHFLSCYQLNSRITFLLCYLLMCFLMCFLMCLFHHNLDTGPL